MYFLNILIICCISLYLIPTEGDTTNITAEGKENSLPVLNRVIRIKHNTTDEHLDKDIESGSLKPDKEEKKTFRKFTKTAKNGTDIKPRFLGSIVMPMLMPLVGKFAKLFLLSDSATTTDPDFDIPTTQRYIARPAATTRPPLQININTQQRPGGPAYSNNQNTVTNQQPTIYNNNPQNKYNVQPGNVQNTQPQPNNRVIVINHEPNVYVNQQLQQPSTHYTNNQQPNNQMHTTNNSHRNTIKNNQLPAPATSPNGNNDLYEYYEDESSKEINIKVQTVKS